MSVRTVPVDRAIAAIHLAWEEQCCGNRNEDVCESCRAYAEAIRCIEWVHKYPEEKP